MRPAYGRRHDMPNLNAGRRTPSTKAETFRLDPASRGVLALTEILFLSYLTVTMRCRPCRYT